MSVSPNRGRVYPAPSIPNFRQRKSSTIISVYSDPNSSPPKSSIPIMPSENLPSTSPITSTGPSSYSDSDVVPSLARDSNISLRSEYSSPPSFKSEHEGDDLDHFYSSNDLRGSNPHSAIPAHMRDLVLSRRSSIDSSIAAEEGEATPLLSHDAEDAPRGKWYEGPLFVTGVKLAILFLIFTAVVVGTFWFGMPKVDPEDRGVLKLPRSFADLQALNTLFQKYKNKYPLRILACGVVSYLFVQTFSLPGSMYISILFGAAYGMVYGLLLSCLCDSFGSMLCYTLSALLAPPLLSLPFYRARVETWRTKIMGDPKKGQQASWDAIFAFLLVLRISPFPPHWVANFVAPHLGIHPGMFWLTAFIGIAPVSVIHVTIGSSLDSMTSADDFHILSLRNVLGLGAVIVAVLIPVGLKRIFKNDLGELGEAEGVLEETSIMDDELDVPPVHQILEVDENGLPKRYQAIDSGVVLAGPSAGDPSLDLDLPAPSRKGKGKALEIITDIIHEDEEIEEQEEYTLFRGENSGDVRVVPNEKRTARSSLPGYGSINTPSIAVNGQERRY